MTGRGASCLVLPSLSRRLPTTLTLHQVAGAKLAGLNPPGKLHFLLPSGANAVTRNELQPAGA